ncbi:MAG TPA: S8 family peptidase [Fimbriimonadaceae bacterium]|nr:S8 family peptidase [Fimbriimonadaceae bacterium]
MLVAFAACLLGDWGPALGDGAFGVHPTRLLVRHERALPAALAVEGIQVLGDYPEIRYAIVETLPGRLLESKRLLEGITGVTDVQFDYAKRLAYDPNDAMWPEMWHFRTINAHRAWDLSWGSYVRVAVIDTGLELAHPDIAANVSRNTDEIANNGIDDDRNGYVDDVMGYDFAYNDPIVEDTYGHGTPCSGIVAAVQNNWIGVTGIAPRARIVPIKACNDAGYLYDSYLVPAYLYAAQRGVKVISMSYFSDRVSPAERAALDHCIGKGILPVAAAGNANSSIPFYPAAYEGVLSVAATDGSNARAGFSCFGTWVDVAAPGVSLRTIRTGGGYTTGFGGTSGACPHVAGVAALLFGEFPKATADQVRGAIEDSALPLNQWPMGEYANYGLVNAEAALHAMQTPLRGKETRVRYLTPLGYESVLTTASPRGLPTARIYGRAFDKARSLEVYVDAAPVRIVQRGRDFIDVLLNVNTGTLRVIANLRTIATIPLAGGTRVTYTPADASTQSATVVGGFSELAQADGRVLTCSRRSDGRIRFDATCRRVILAPATAETQSQVTIRRMYAGGTAGIERVYVYDWSSGSYPYGSWVEVGSSSLPTTMTTSTYNLPGLARFVDPEGSLYLLVEASDTLDGTQIQVDRLALTKPR